MRKTALQNKHTLNSYSANGKQTAERTSDLITFYAALELFEACLRPILDIYSNISDYSRLINSNLLQRWKISVVEDNEVRSKEDSTSKQAQVQLVKKQPSYF